MNIRATWRGADEFVDALKVVSRRLPEFTKDEALIAATTVADDFRPKVPFLTGKARSSVKVTQAENDAVLSRGVNVPYWFWLEFGGTTGKGHKPGRGGGSVKIGPFGKSGRFYWRSLDKHYEHILDAAGRRLVVLMRRSRLEVTELHGHTQRR